MKKKNKTKPNEQKALPNQLQLPSSTWVELIPWIIQSVHPVQPPWTQTFLRHPGTYKINLTHQHPKKRSVWKALSHMMYPLTRKWQSLDNGLNSWPEAKRTESAGSICGRHKTITPVLMGSGISIHYERPRDTGKHTFFLVGPTRKFYNPFGPSVGRHYSFWSVNISKSKRICIAYHKETWAEYMHSSQLFSFLSTIL